MMGNTTRDVVCWHCRRASKIGADRPPYERRCPECSGGMTNLGKTGLRIPPRDDVKAWDKLRQIWAARFDQGSAKRDRAERIGRPQ